MERLLSLVLLITLAFTLSGCGSATVYTQEEVDDMFDTLDYFTDGSFTLDMESNDDYIFELELRISELEENYIVVNYTDCSMMQLAQEILEASELGYTFEIDQYGTMYELRDGVYTGDTFTNEDLLEQFCTIGGEIE